MRRTRIRFFRYFSPPLRTARRYLALNVRRKHDESAVSSAPAMSELIPWYRRPEEHRRGNHKDKLAFKLDEIEALERALTSISVQDGESAAGENPGETRDIVRVRPPWTAIFIHQPNSFIPVRSLVKSVDLPAIYTADSGNRAPELLRSVNVDAG